MILDFDLLKAAWRKTVELYSEQPNKAKFKYNLVPNLFKLERELEDGTFKPTGFRTQIIWFPKKRIVQVPSIRDKVVQHAICDNYVTKRLTKPLIKETFACLQDRGTLYASDILKNQLRSYYRVHGSDFYVLKCDIKSYFASIPHDRIFQLIDRYIEDQQVVDIMHRFIDMMPVGLALGLQQSQLLANLYLSDLDHKCKELLGAKYYGRYMDDFYIISEDYTFLENCLRYIDQYVQSIGLTLNPKTGIFSNKLDFVGFTYYLTETGHVVKLIAKGKKRSKRRHIQKMLRQIDEGLLSVEDFVTRYQGWRAHALQGDCATLVAVWDSVVTDVCKEHGYLIIFQGNKVNLCQEHSNNSTSAHR